MTWSTPEPNAVARRDLILSSGFLAFARHVGFLRAVEEAGLEVGAVCGTSSGALAAALWASGMPAAQVGVELSAHRPVRWLRPSLRPWRGLLRIDPLISRLRELLPESFAELERPLAVGVRGPGSTSRMLSEGALPEAVAASCAIPGLFHGVLLDGIRYDDGGVVDRLGLAAWRKWRPGRSGLAHWVERTRGVDLAVDSRDLEVVRTPPSGASFLDLGDFEAQVEEARELTLGALTESATSPGGAPPGGAPRRGDR